MASPPALPARFASFSDIPSRPRPLYDGVADSAYTLTEAGRLLAHYRAKRAADPVGEIRAPSTTITKRGWAELVAAATPGAEREWLLKSAASKRVTIKD
jgi:hypothetical protein